MEIEKEKINLNKLIKNYLLDKASLDDLNKFVWDKIDYFVINKGSISPCEEKEEGEFWYAIWQIQHLVSECQEDQSLFEDELKNILEIFDNKAALPKIYYGKRPV